MGLFGTSGIRGSAKTLFSNKFCLDIGYSFVEFLKKHKSLGPVAIGMDPRPSSPRIKAAVIKGLATGVEIFDQGISPIPSMNWILKAGKVVASLMITGSHIAPQFNGIKFFALKEEITKDHEQEIEEIYNSLKKTPPLGGDELGSLKMLAKGEKFHRTTGLPVVIYNKIKGKTRPVKKPYVHIDTQAQELYREMLEGLADNQILQWRIVVDCANGAQSILMPDLLESFGMQVFRVNCRVQDEFIARDTDTDDKVSIEQLKATVLREKADFGIAYDGDGDRVVFVDELGQFIQGEYTCSLVARSLQTPVIVTTISASQVVETIGKKVVRTKVGSPYVIEGMKESGSLFGFEPNGGAIFGNIMYTRDGGAMTIKLLNLFAEFRGTFSKFVAQIPRFYMLRTKVNCPTKLNEKILQKVRKHFMGERLEEIDGIKIWIDKKTWVLFRPSANAPEFRVFAESVTPEVSESLLQKGMGLVENVIKES